MPAQGNTLHPSGSCKTEFGNNMRKIKLFEINEIFEKLLNEKISREATSNWALDIQNAQDSNLLEFFPSEDEEIIWDAILFLIGVDIKDSPDTYLYNDEDIKSYKNLLKC